MRAAVILLGVLALPACDQPPQAPVQGQRIAFDEVGAQVREPLASPDTEEASWTVANDGQKIEFGNPGEPPFLSLACRITDDPPQLRIIRHALALPGEKALFPVIGNGTISRFKMDAALTDEEWRWEGALSADDPRLEVFTGTRELEATLPGAGSLIIEGSRIPGEFISWCRAGGEVHAVVEEEQQAEETD